MSSDVWGCWFCWDFFLKAWKKGENFLDGQKLMTRARTFQVLLSQVCL